MREPILEQSMTKTENFKEFQRRMKGICSSLNVMSFKRIYVKVSKKKRNAEFFYARTRRKKKETSQKRAELTPNNDEAIAL